MTEQVKIAIENYLNRKGLLNVILSFISRNHSQYKIKLHSETKSEILLFINNEYRLRKDHFEQLKYIQQYLLSLGLNSTMISSKRVFHPFRFWNYQKQFDYIFQLITQTNHFKKVIVFCDSVPLQTYIVDQFNNLGVETFSLQHGFYAEDNSDVFKKVYQASNAKNFFVWDNRTLKYMKKYNSDRKYIKTGPHYKSDFKPKVRPKAKSKIAIYSCGKDQIKENIYLSKLYIELQSQSISCILIAHPKINLFEKMNFYFKYKVWMSSNSNKKYSYTNSLILNSSVYLELEELGENYFILNEHYLKNITPTPEDYFSSKKDESSSILKPFQNPDNALKTIIKTLTHDF